MEHGPIEVSNRPMIEQLWTGVRAIAVAGGAFALGRGWIQQDTAGFLGVAGAVVWGVVAAQIKTWQRSKKLVTLANAVGDDVAILK